MIPLLFQRIPSLPTRFEVVSSVLCSLSFPVTPAGGKHPFPFRTRQLSPPAPMVLRAQVGGGVGRRREVFSKRPWSSQGPLVWPAVWRGGAGGGGRPCCSVRPWGWRGGGLLGRGR